jgi:hypothetical protein
VALEDRGHGSKGWTTLLLAAFGIAVALAGCTSSPAPQNPGVRTTKAFDTFFGDLPTMAVPGPSYGTVVYFPSMREPGKYRPVPIFSAEQGKEEMLSVRTAIRGIDLGGLADEVSFSFPTGSDLVSFIYEGGIAKIKVGGAFRATDISGDRGERAADALALTVAQFGKAAAVDLTDAPGNVHFSGRADRAQTADIGLPKLLGLLAIKEDKDHPPSVLSALFDRPIFVEEISFYPPEGNSAYPGNAYSTGFGMSVEFHPEPKAVFDAIGAYRVRLSVRDGKGRRMGGEKASTAKVVTRD